MTEEKTEEPTKEAPKKKASSKKGKIETTTVGDYLRSRRGR